MIRVAIIDDLEQIVAINNQAIDAKFQTGFTERFNPADKKDWLYGHIGTTYPLFVDIERDKIRGWFSVSPYREGRNAFRYSVEISYFIDKDHQQKGIGTQLVAHGLEACKRLGYKSVIAILLDKNTGSIKLLEKFGFERWAFLPRVADFDGVLCDHLYYGKTIK